MENPLADLNEDEISAIERTLEEIDRGIASSDRIQSVEETTNTHPNSINSNNINNNEMAVYGRNSNSSEDSILVIDCSNEKNNQLTCIDLTENDDQSNDIIIEAHVGSRRLNRARRNVNRCRESTNSNNMDNTIVIDDDRPEPTSTTSTNYLSTRNLSRSLIRPFPEMPVTSRRAGHPHSAKRTRLNTKEKILVEKAKGLHPPKPPIQPESDSNGPTISCPICLENLAELKSHNKRLKSTTCGHILCNECLDATFKSSVLKTINCPTCRTKLTKAKIHDLFL